MPRADWPAGTSVDDAPRLPVVRCAGESRAFRRRNGIIDSTHSNFYGPNTPLFSALRTLRSSGGGHANGNNRSPFAERRSHDGRGLCIWTRLTCKKTRGGLKLESPGSNTWPLENNTAKEVQPRILPATRRHRLCVRTDKLFPELTWGGGSVAAVTFFFLLLRLPRP